MDKNKFVEFGKLGGRPKKEIRKTERITLRFTPQEFELLKTKSLDKNFKNLTDYCTTILNEKELPNFEKNSILIKYATNFTRIANFMQQGIFNEYEKKYLIAEIQAVINGIKASIKW